MSLISRAFFLLAFLFAGAAHAAEVPRVIIGLHDAPLNAPQDANYLYDLAEMPLNHLGLVLEYHRVREEVPKIGARKDVRGVLIWLTDGRKLPLKKITDLVAEAVARDIPVVLIGNLPGGIDDQGKAVTLADQNKLLQLIGVRSDGGYVPYTYDLKVASKDSAMTEFERPLPSPLPPLESITPTDPTAKSYLIFERKGEGAGRLNAVIATAKGGYVAAGYSHYEDKSGTWSQWYLNPFAFFRITYRTADMPIPDTTTVSGRRIFYSHIDGDGWGNVSTVDAYNGQGLYASEVILREVAKGYPDLPVTVAPIAADVDPAWAGTIRTQQIARAFFKLPNVEPSTHTYTHPFEWAFFGPSYRPQNELMYVKRYPKVRVAPGLVEDKSTSHAKLQFPYDAPRAYAEIPYSLKREVEASVAYINSLAPPGKQVKLLQWSGDTSPTEDAVAATIKAGLLNINGRDTRFDGDQPSYSAVSPVGKLSGKLMQISASHANENVYTDLWQGRFFGFRYLKTSLERTEAPLRVKPINIYYHMYSGEKQASLAALKEVLTYSSRQDIAPITATDYAAIGQGFFTTKLTELSPRVWRVDGRGTLNTLRFDNAKDLVIDQAKSVGVLGARVTKGVLYVSLDGAVQAPVVALKPRDNADVRAPMLIDSRWVISNLQVGAKATTFNAIGFGPGIMTWHIPRSAQGSNERWEARLDTGRTAVGVADANGFVRFALPSGAEQGVRVTIGRADLRPSML